MNIELNNIYNMDCLEGMKYIKDKSVDMILCDLPYGTTRNKWDSVIPLEPLWTEYERIIKDDGAIILTAQTPFDKVLGVSNLRLLRYEWIWRKDAGTGFLNAKKMPLKDHENVLVFYKKLPTYNPQMRGNEVRKVRRKDAPQPTTNYGFSMQPKESEYVGRYPLTTVEFKRDSDKVHPTQKPVALFEYLIKTYTNEGETVLDNCMGSGTTAVAATNTNRNYIGFEMDKDYYEASLERIKNN